MKKNLAVPLAALLLLLPLLLAPVYADTIRLRADEWFPVNGDPQSSRPGFAVELAATIWRDFGHQIDYQLMGWGRSLEAARNGSIDCVIGTDRTEAPDLLFPQTPLHTDGVHVYVRKGDNWRFTDESSLARRTVAVINEYSYGGQMDAWLADPANATRIQMAYGEAALEGNIRKLLAGRVDLLLESPMVMSVALQDLELARYVTDAGESDPPTPFYIACGSSNPKTVKWLQQFDQGAEKLKESGAWQAILERYGLQIE